MRTRTRQVNRIPLHPAARRLSFGHRGRIPDLAAWLRSCGREAQAAQKGNGATPLDTVIASPPAIADDIVAALDGAIAHVAIPSALLVRIELPPETRRMLTAVERSRRDGLAALERARGEQASMRALANAARLVKDNPELAQLRLLRTIEDARGPTTIVVGDPRAVPL